MIMKKLRYITPVVIITDMKVDTDIMKNSLENYAGGVSTKERDELEEEVAAAIQEAQKYSLW